MQRIAVIGLGRFGMHLARKLGSGSGVQVIAIDHSSQLVNDVKDDVAIAVRLDSTDQLALTSQEIHKVDVAVVSIGENFEAALLTTVILKKLGVPKIICRAQTEFHAEIFRQIGADKVIQPESEAGEELARKLMHPQLEDVLILAEGYTLIELRAPSVFCGKSLKDLAIRTRYGVNLVAIKRTVKSEVKGETVEQHTIIGVPKPDDVIQPGDILVLVGSDQALAQLPKQ